MQDLELYTKAFVQPGALRYDPNVTPLPFTPTTVPSKLKIGYFIDNGFCKPAPPVVHALNDAISKLKAAGHHLVEFQPPEINTLIETVIGFFGAYYDGLLKVVGPNSKTKDPFIPALANLAAIDGLPEGHQGRDARMSSNWARYGSREHIKTLWTNKVLDMGLDAIVCPTAAIPAPPHDLSGITTAAISYTMTFNLLDWTAGVIPVRTVQKEDLVPMDGARGELEKGVVETWNAGLESGCWENAKVGLQVAGLRLTEEKTLEVMKVRSFPRGEGGT